MSWNWRNKDNCPSELGLCLRRDNIYYSSASAKKIKAQKKKKTFWFNLTLSKICEKKLNINLTNILSSDTAYIQEQTV